jgi:hypothetical protein
VCLPGMPKFEMELNFEREEREESTKFIQMKQGSHGGDCISLSMYLPVSDARQ